MNGNNKKVIFYIFLGLLLVALSFFLEGFRIILIPAGLLVLFSVFSKLRSSSAGAPAPASRVVGEIGMVFVNAALIIFYLFFGFAMFLLSGFGVGGFKLTDRVFVLIAAYFLLPIGVLMPKSSRVRTIVLLLALALLAFFFLEPIFLNLARPEPAIPL